MPDANSMPTPGEAMHAQGRIPHIEDGRYGCLAFVGIWVLLGIIAAVHFSLSPSAPQPAAVSDPSNPGAISPELVDAWSGKLTEKPSKKSNNVVIDLRQVPTGELVGELTYGKSKCRVNLRLVSVRQSGATVTEEPAAGKKRCIGSGKIELTLQENELALKWSKSGTSQQGNLKRK